MGFKIILCCIMLIIFFSFTVTMVTAKDKDLANMKEKIKARVERNFLEEGDDDDIGKRRKKRTSKGKSMEERLDKHRTIIHNRSKKYHDKLNSSNKYDEKEKEKLRSSIDELLQSELIIHDSRLAMHKEMEYAREIKDKDERKAYLSAQKEKQLERRENNHKIQDKITELRKSIDSALKSIEL